MRTEIKFLFSKHFSQLTSDLTFASLGIRNLFAYHYKKYIKSLEGSEAAAAGQKTLKNPSQTEFAQVVYAVLMIIYIKKHNKLGLKKENYNL